MLLDVSVTPTDLATVLARAWQLMNIEFTYYGFTCSYGKIFLFEVLISLVIFAIFHFLWKG